jgi:hypothetical protein
VFYEYLGAYYNQNDTGQYFYREAYLLAYIGTYYKPECGKQE